MNGLRHHSVVALSCLAVAFATAAAPAQPPVADRALDNLVCLCGRCARLRLSRCTCPVAAKERQFVLELLKSDQFPKSDDEAYKFLVAAYRERHGGAAVLATESEGPFSARHEGEWVYSPAEIAVTIAGASILIAAAEFLRRRSERLAKRVPAQKRRRS